MSDSESDSTSESTSEIKTEVLGEPATVESDSGSVAAENTTTMASTTTKLSVRPTTDRPMLLMIHRH